MSTFAQLLAGEKSGLVWLIDVSFNDFASISYRWSTASVRVGGNDYDGRIASMTPITRSFGREHLPAASTFKATISNSDFGADWMLDRTTVATQLLRARFRLTAYLYDSSSYAAADSLSGASQTIGYFTCLNQPASTDSAVELTLSDDSLGRLAEPLTTPTVRDWFDAATLINFNTGEPTPAMDWDVPLPLVFGLGEFGVQVPCYNAVQGYNQFPLVGLNDRNPSPTTTGDRTFPLIVCVAKAGNNSYQPSFSEITRLQGTFRRDISWDNKNTLQQGGLAGATIEIPRKYKVQTAVVAYEIEIWSPRRSVPITKNGRTWEVVYIDFNLDLYVVWFLNNFYPGQDQLLSGGAQVQHGWVPTYYYADTRLRAAVMYAFESFHCNGTPLSVVSTLQFDGGTIASKRLVDQIYDAIVYYSKASASDMDATAWSRASKARATVMGAGIIQPSRPRPLQGSERNGWVSPNPRDGIVGVLRTALGDMCASADVDLFMTKEGLYSVATNVFDFTAVTGTRVDVSEARTSRVRVRTPSQGERWAPYNRVMLIGPGGGSWGPYDNQDAIDAWGVVLPVTLNGKWSNGLTAQLTAFGSNSIWQQRNLESKVRPAVNFLADREYLGLELGDYFTFTYSRGGQGSVFNGTLFRLEGQRIDPANLSVELDAIWVDDLVTDRPFLLDDEQFLIRVASSAGRTVTVVDGIGDMTMSSGDVIADGVQEGDILELRDSTQAADVFSRYRRLRISDVFDATHISCADTDTNFGAGAGVAVAEWTIYRGAITYPTSSTDPVNYPSGGTMYGKASDANDQYSDTSAANKLLDG
jgi:hypothetical protein